MVPQEVVMLDASRTLHCLSVSAVRGARGPHPHDNFDYSKPAGVDHTEVLR
jgi:hypothetical protein